MRTRPLAAFRPERGSRVPQQVLTDVEIARSVELRPIAEIARQIGLDPDEIEYYGPFKAKLPLEILDRLQGRANGRLVLVTAISPTPAGEGKTTVTIGLGQALQSLGKRALIALREPSLGPVFGVKGGATGGGRAQIGPMADINLHFTGDMHAITAAHNLLAAMLDNHLHQGNALDIDVRRIVWPRAIDMNDRALRDVVIGLGGTTGGVPRESGFLITPASEVMAILALAESLSDLKERLGRIIVAYTRDGDPVTAADLKAHGAMAALLRDAIKPNLVQTLEHSPALVHAGPFGNIAHGCNSLLATRIGLKLADILVTEAGFGADLGGEKFLDIKCRVGGLKPDLAVLVATVRALKWQGGAAKDDLSKPDLLALRRGFAHLDKHIENLGKFGLPVVVAINRFTTDTDEEVEALCEHCNRLGAECASVEVWARGGEGGAELAQLVLDVLEQRRESRFQPLYSLDLPVTEKIATIAREIYGAASVEYGKAAQKAIRDIERQGLGRLPICIAKTQYSLSDDPTRLGRPEGFVLHVREVRASAGAGFIVAVTGDIMTMPGLPKTPAAEVIDVAADGEIVGLS